MTALRDWVLKVRKDRTRDRSEGSSNTDDPGRKGAQMGDILPMRVTPYTSV